MWLSNLCGLEAFQLAMPARRAQGHLCPNLGVSSATYWFGFEGANLAQTHEVVKDSFNNSLVGQFGCRRVAAVAPRPLRGLRRCDTQPDVASRREISSHATTQARQ